MATERRVGRFTCGEVLDRLAGFVDGTLDADELAQVKVHVGGCDTCEKFGGEYAAIVHALRTTEPGANDAEALADALLARVGR